MVETTSLAEHWQDRGRAQNGPSGYCTPCVIYRLNDPEATTPDKGVQILIEPEGNGRYTVSRLEFFLRHHDNYSNGTPESTTILLRGQKPDAAIQAAFEQMGRELETVKLLKDISPQVWKYRKPAHLPDAQPLAKLPGFAAPEDKAAAEAVLQRLSSRWGKKTANFHQIPTPKRPIADFEWR